LPSQPAAEAPTLWRPYVDGRIDGHEISGAHQELMQAEHLAEIARVITEKLARHER
jgi:nonribosomal peptide synthetase DhbF